MNKEGYLVLLPEPLTNFREIFNQVRTIKNFAEEQQCVYLGRNRKL